MNEVLENRITLNLKQILETPKGGPSKNSSVKETVKIPWNGKDEEAKS